MIENKLEYREWCRNNGLGENAIGNYVTWLNKASEYIGEEISYSNLSSEDDIDRMINLLKQHPDKVEINATTLQNTRSAMRKYLAMVTEKQNLQSNPLIDPVVKESLLEMFASMQTQGSLPTEAYLQESYKTFRDNFGPEKLRSIEGIELLRLIHGRGNNDSLVYMLEFQCKEFGGIRGGDATKFGIYFRQQTNEWITGTGRAPRIISEEEAIQYVTRQRDQLLAGIAALSDLPQDASDKEYIALQNKLENEAPDICNNGWTHKYWHMLFPDKLDDYHNEKWHRYHLIKLLQLPPIAQGLYTCAGRFIQIAKELDWPINYLTSVLNSVHGNPTNYWLIGTKLGGERSIWQDMQRGNYAAIGWGTIGSLDTFINDNRSNTLVKQEISSKLLADGHYTEQSVRTRKAGEILDFLKNVQKNDLIIAVEGQRVIGVGRVSGDYYFENTPPVDAFHRRKVDWLSFEEWKLPEAEGIRTTVCNIKKEVNMLAVEHVIAHYPVDLTTQPQIEPQQLHVEIMSPYTIENMINEGVFLESSEIDKIKNRLESKKNLILQGAPGVGKTFVAKKLAYVLMGEKADDRIVSVQFHPSYSYEDFVRGYRPTDEAGKFELIDGSFWSFCDKARNNPDKKHVMLIDEINRGNLSQIFGELFMLVEADKRGELVTPLYRHKNNQEEQFSIPPNVYLIGTMNIADRSLALVDYALRRRFAFVTLEPKFDSDAFYRWLENDGADDELILKITERMIELNVRISEDRQLGAAYRVGHSFFCNKPSGGCSDAWFNEVIETEIIPLLEEYWHDNPEQLKQASNLLA